MDAGRVIREWRVRAGLTQRGLAARGRMPQSALARIETGRVIPRVDTLERLLALCGAGLTADRRLGSGVERKAISALLRLDPRQRLLATRMKGFSPLRLLTVLAGRRVRFVVVGAAAERLHGAPVPVRELDICPEVDEPNGRRLLAALRALGAPLTRGLSPRAARFGAETKFGRVVGIRVPSSVDSWDELDRASTPVPLASGREIRVAALDDLIRIRMATCRADDRSRAEVLGAVRDEIDASG